MSRPITEPTYGRSQERQGYDIRQLQRREIPGPWIPVTVFLNSWANAGGGLRQLRYRDSGMFTTDIEGVVNGGTAPSIVTVLLDTPLPDESQPIPGTGGHDWQLDPDGSLWIIT